MRSVFALFFRALQQEGRRTGAHFVRALVAAAILLVLYCNQTAWNKSAAAGMAFFRLITVLNGLFVTFAGFTLFATSITEEKEEETLGLLKMAGVSTDSFLIGKSFSKLFVVLLMLVVQIPFVMLAVTLGGITPHQILATYVALAAYAFVISNLGLLVSVIAHTSRGAIGLALLFTLLFWATSCELLRICGSSRVGFAGAQWISTPPYIQFLSPFEAINFWVQFRSLFSVTFRIMETLSTGFCSAIWDMQFFSSIAVGLGLYLLARRSFAKCTDARRIVSLEKESLPLTVRKWRLSAAERTWQKYPIAWREFHFGTGGWLMLCIKGGTYSAIIIFFFIIYGMTRRLLGGHAEVFHFNDRYVQDLLDIQLFAFTLLFFFELALNIGNLLQTELKAQTWQVLSTLPRSTVRIISDKFIGCAVGLIPIFATWSLVLFFNQKFWSCLQDNPGCIPFFLSAEILLLAHILRLSTFLRNALLPISLLSFIPILVASQLLILPAILNTEFLIDYRIRNGQQPFPLQLFFGSTALRSGLELLEMARRRDVMLVWPTYYFLACRIHPLLPAAANLLVAAILFAITVRRMHHLRSQ